LPEPPIIDELSKVQVLIELRKIDPCHCRLKLFDAASKEVVVLTHLRHQKNKLVAYKL
jgi:hypothetical protein